MRLAICLLLVCSIAGAQNPPTVVQGVAFDLGDRVTLTGFAEAQTSIFAVTVKDAKAEEVVIVDVCYWTTIDISGITASIVRCKTSVVPALSEGGAETDDVPAPLDKIQSIKVKIATVTEYEELNGPAFKSGNPAGKRHETSG